jgi:hypothetical protein
MKLAIRSPKAKAIMGAGIVASLGGAFTAYHVANLTETIVTAGTVAPEGALESIMFIVDGQEFVLSIVPAGLRAKLIVGGLLVVGVGWLTYVTYKYINRVYTLRDERAVDFNKPLSKEYNSPISDEDKEKLMHLKEEMDLNGSANV